MRERLWHLYLMSSGVVLFAAWRLSLPGEQLIFLLVIFCLAYEYYGERRPKAPTRLISLLSFLIVLSQFRYENGLQLMFSLLAYLVTMIFVLKALFLHDHYQLTLGQVWRKFFPRAVGHTIIAVLVGTVVFWFLPRPNDYSFSLETSLQSQRISAFSDEVDLNNITRLKMSRVHMMDLVPLDGELHSPYLKGQLLDSYSEGKWHSGFTYMRYPRVKNRVFSFFDEPEGAPSFRYELDVKPIQGNTIFFFNDLISVQLPMQAVRMQGPLTKLQLAHARPMSLRYIVKAIPEGQVEHTDRYNDHYLDLPPSVEFLKDEVARILGDRTENPQQVIETLLDYFQREFGYSLNIYNVGVENPLEEFLLNTKQGHCELFASSMALMLRTAGIPSRLATGFLINEKHPSGDFYYVRASDAHAWVEAFVDGHWISVDPTPQVIPPQIGGWEAFVANLNHTWRKYVVRFDAFSQKEILSDIALNLQNNFQALQNDPSQLFALLPILLGLGVLIWFGVMVWRRKFRTPKHVLSKAYMDLDRLLASQFSARRPHQTHGDYLKRLGLSDSLKERMAQWLAGYQAVRFGAGSIDPLKVKMLVKESRELQKALKQS